MQPTNSVEASRRLAAQNGIKKAPKGLSVPLLPDSGVADHPIGLMLLVAGAGLGLWVRRAARA